MAEKISLSITAFFSTPRTAAINIRDLSSLHFFFFLYTFFVCLRQSPEDGSDSVPSPGLDCHHGERSSHRNLHGGTEGSAFNCFCVQPAFVRCLEEGTFAEHVRAWEQLSYCVPLKCCCCLSMFLISCVLFLSTLEARFITGIL